MSDKDYLLLKLDVSVQKSPLYGIADLLEGSEIQGHPQLHTQLWANLSSMRLIPQNKWINQSKRNQKYTFSIRLKSSKRADQMLSSLEHKLLSCRGPGFNFQHPHGDSNHLKLQFQQIQCLLPASTNTRHTCGTHKCMEAKHSNIKSKINLNFFLLL